MGEGDYDNSTEFLIVKAFIDLLGEKPYDKVKVKNVVEKCGIARSTFYEYFADVFDLLEKIERMLLDELVLYKSNQKSPDDAFGGTPFESMEHWFEIGLSWKNTLHALLGDNGDPYFMKRLQVQIRGDLNRMMDFDNAPKDKLRPYYVELLTASYLGMLTYIASVDEEDHISTYDMARIANSTRRAYFRTEDGAPYISERQLTGGSSDGLDGETDDKS